MDIREAFEKSLIDLEIDAFDGNPDDILSGTGENEETSEFEDVSSEELLADIPEEDLPSEQADRSPATSTIVDIREGVELRMPDGTIVPADKAVLLQADYTRKTQEVAEKRREVEQYEAQLRQDAEYFQAESVQMREWYTERSANPSGWIAEIVAASPDGTSVIAKALYDLAQAGKLDPQFVETFGLTSGPIAETAKTAAVESEVAALRRQIEQREHEQQTQQMNTQRQAMVAQRADVYEKEWQDIKQKNGLQFNSMVEEAATKKELLKFAIENRVSKSLYDAWDLLNIRRSRSGLQRPNTSSSDVSDKKRASRAVTPKTAVSGEAKRPKKKFSDREAILEAMAEVGL
jgi:hypothetical protein